MKYLILIVLYPVENYCQKLSTEELISILHVQNNNSLKKEIRKFFKEKNDCNLFYVTSSIEPIALGNFQNELIELQKEGIDLGISEECVLNTTELNNFCDFKPFTKKALESLIPRNGQRLKLRFSKQLGNLLPLEVVSHNSPDKGGITFGKMYQIIFVFNDNNEVIKVLTKTMIR